jgi:hypothetical protein
MELCGEGEEEKSDEAKGEDEMLYLPEEWIFSVADQYEQGETSYNQIEDSKPKNTESNPKQISQDKQTYREEVFPEYGGREKTKKQQWGPVVVKEKSRRQAEDGRTIMEKAQDIKRKWNEAETTGKIKQKHLHVSASDLSNLASAIDVVSKDGHPVSSMLINEIESVESRKSKKHEESCDKSSCDLVGCTMNNNERDTD